MDAKKRYPLRLQSRFLWLLVTLFATTFVDAQNSNDSIIVDTLASGEPVYDWRKVDQKPEFPGGEEALLTDYLCAYYYDPRVYITIIILSSQHKRTLTSLHILKNFTNIAHKFADNLIYKPKLKKSINLSIPQIRNL